MSHQVFNSKGVELEVRAFHPGIYLLEEIEERELAKKDVAKALGILPTNLSEIFAGKRNISPKVAVRLEKYLGVSADYWMNLQTSWDIQEARELEHV
ncbi:HigA family addiction module antitoxin [Olivibacter sitiensis]|uniref:HigA family addiction module antitoxin n=1 Tax=Olivibacter sitiensis TaxID=376470 RepID=UPI000400D3E5|nr:HigA family addiction module antitoxin [Olivibacter sitiensis]